MSTSALVLRQLAAGLVFVAALAAQSPSPDTAGTDIVATRAEVTADGKVLRYTAHAGHIAIRDNEAGDVHGNMFFVAYTLDRAPGGRPRPLTFVWNGGPGSNSGLVHLLGFGPKRITAATGSMPRFSPWGTALVDNQDTWLVHTDLVFVDPIGTGYSRPTRPEYASEFYQGRGDAESVAEFIRLYRTRFDAFDAPLFIAGESYGVTRASLVADALERRRTNLSGVILLSGGFPLSETPPVLRNALSLPTLTAAAFTNHKLPSDLQSGDLLKALHAAEAYAQTEYAAALARRDSLSAAEKDAVVAQLARFTGLASSQIDRNTLRVTTDQLSNLLMAPQVVGRYDSRLLGPRDTAARQYDPTTDPSLKDILDPVSVVRYMRNVLGFKSDLFYQGPFGGGYPPATTFRGDWMSVRWNRGAPAPAAGAAAPNAAANTPPNTSQALRAAMNTNPRLRVLVASGYYDLVSSYYEIEYSVKHLPPELARRVTVHSYPGGHAAYTDDTVRHQFRADVAAFVQAATSR